MNIRLKGNFVQGVLKLEEGSSKQILLKLKVFGIREITFLEGFRVKNLVKPKKKLRLLSKNRTKCLATKIA